MIQFPSGYEKNVKLWQYVEPVIESNSKFAWIFTGVPGCGKTMAANLIYDALVAINANNHRYSAIGISAQQLYREYLTATETGKTDDIKSIEAYLCRDLVMIDDLGWEMETNASKTFFANMLSLQYDHYQDGKMNQCIITTNLNYAGIEKVYGTRIIDRICEHYTILAFSNQSYRKDKLRVVKL